MSFRDFLLGKPAEVVEAPEDVVEEPVVEGPQPGDRYYGPLAFSEGWFHPVAIDDEGRELGPDFSAQIIWDEVAGDGHWRYAHPEDVNHFHRYGLTAVEITPEQ